MAEHQHKNTNYQLCILCNRETDRCEEDEFNCDACYELGNDLHSPYCESCYDAHISGHKVERDVTNDQIKKLKQTVSIFNGGNIRIAQAVQCINGHQYSGDILKVTAIDFVNDEIAKTLELVKAVEEL